MSATRAAGALACATLTAATGCQSTQDKSAEEAANAKRDIKVEESLRVGKPSKVVKVGRTTVLTDANGTAAVVELRNRSRKGLVNVPLAVTVTDGRKAVYRNDDPGLEPSLVAVPYIAPGARIAWVNDQIVPTGDARKVRATPGAARRKIAGREQVLAVGRPRLTSDSEGAIAAGTVRNRGKRRQTSVVIYAVARKGKRVVAAGRGLVEEVGPGRRAGYEIFFIGDPKGARLDLVAPPTVIR